MGNQLRCDFSLVGSQRRVGCSETNEPVGPYQARGVGAITACSSEATVFCFYFTSVSTMRPQQDDPSMYPRQIASTLRFCGGWVSAPCSENVRRAAAKTRCIV